MQIILSDGRCFIEPFIKGRDVKSKSDQEGMGYYGNLCGWILSWLGYAAQIKDENNHVFYLNRKSAIYWIRNHQETFDDSRDSIQAKIEAIAAKALKTPEKKIEEITEAPAKVSLEQLRSLAVSAQGNTVTIPGRGTFPWKLLSYIVYQTPKPTEEDLNTPRKIKLSDKILSVDGIIIEGLCTDSKIFKFLCKGTEKNPKNSNDTIDFSQHLSHQEWTQLLEFLYQEFITKDMHTSIQCNWRFLKILVSNTEGDKVDIPGRGIFSKKMLQLLLN